MGSGHYVREPAGGQKARVIAVPGFKTSFSDSLVTSWCQFYDNLLHGGWATTRSGGRPPVQG